MNDELKKKVDNAINRLQLFEPAEGYYLAFSGGKDSVVIKRLADMAGVKYKAHYNVTSVDPPELVRFIKDRYPDVSIDVPKDKNGRQISMWSLIRKRGLPTRIRRFCCEKLKETQSLGNVVITGVRWAESNNRKVNQGEIVIRKGTPGIPVNNPDFRTTPRGGVVLVNDNDESRKIVEQCYQKGRVTVNPVVEWIDEDVWNFIKNEGVPYCSLYNEGFSRLGCIGCPLAGSRNQLREFSRWPQYIKLYRAAIGKWIEHKSKTSPTFFSEGNVRHLYTVNDWWHWWLQDRPIGQYVMPGFDDDETEEYEEET